MKVHELITELQNFPMDMHVYCPHEESDWAFNGESSYEVSKIVDGPVARVERWADCFRGEVVRIS